MTTDYTGDAFRPVFNAAMAAWWAGNCEGVNPMENWQCKESEADEFVTQAAFTPQYLERMTYRFKPAPKRMVTIGYIPCKGADWKLNELVAPEVEAPAQWTNFYCPGYWGVTCFAWSADMKKYLDAGLVFLKSEDAQAMSDWLAVCRRGGANAHHD